jgi:hypothetical protein
MEINLPNGEYSVNKEIGNRVVFNPIVHCYAGSIDNRIHHINTVVTVLNWCMLHQGNAHRTRANGASPCLLFPRLHLRLPRGMN